jgi:hypothetical protein
MGILWCWVRDPSQEQEIIASHPGGPRVPTDKFGTEVLPGLDRES